MLRAKMNVSVFFLVVGALVSGADGSILADSKADFSGNQGQDNWFYGYYDQRADVETGNGIYDAADFIGFLNDGSNILSTDPTVGAWKTATNHWDGVSWQLQDAGAVGHGPWTWFQRDTGHPAANGQPDPEVLWTILRWESEQNGPVRITGELENNGNLFGFGDGVFGRIFVDGVEVWSGHSDGAVVTFDFNVDLALGALVDFAMDADGAGNLDVTDPSTLDSIWDGWDTTRFSAVASAVPEASSLAIWSIVGCLGLVGGLKRHLPRLSRKTQISTTKSQRIPKY